MKLEVRPAAALDLDRAEELVVRTHQLNTTGRAYSAAELRDYMESDSHEVVVASLEDRYGPYGTIALALLELTGSAAVLKLFLMSCRVLSRGIGGVLLNHFARVASGRGLSLQAELVPNDRNRLMLVTLRLSGFAELSRSGEVVLLERRAAPEPAPDYLELVTRQAEPRAA
jgi:FkbH-like protein